MYISVEGHVSKTCPHVRFHEEDTLKRIFERLENARIHINRARIECGSCSEAIVEMVEKHSRHFLYPRKRTIKILCENESF